AAIPTEGLHAGAVNRVVWNLRSALGNEQEGDAPQGPPVLPGHYTLRLTAGGARSETGIRVHPDPRDEIPAEVRRAWTASLREVQEAAASANALFESVRDAARDLEAADASARAMKIRDLLRETEELRSRLGRLARSVADHVGPRTGDEEAQHRFLGEMLRTLTGEWHALGGA
ncbi:MAG TPA: hypothetical protein VLA43_19320, partial [Longimicrobiales bacterium]|nr:hypothetical protein [Longimicrobiales bacterium]